MKTFKARYLRQSNSTVKTIIVRSKIHRRGINKYPTTAACTVLTDSHGEAVVGILVDVPEAVLHGEDELHHHNQRVPH